jgi:hypothetical protein
VHRERSLIERDRHARARWYVVVCFALAAGAYLFLGFDRTQTLGYAISCFAMLHIVNYRVMFARIPAEPAEKQRQPNP